MESRPNEIKIISDKRPPLTAEILEKLTAEQKAYDALNCENKKNINLIKVCKKRSVCFKTRSQLQTKA